MPDGLYKVGESIEDVAKRGGYVEVFDRIRIEVTMSQKRAGCM